MGIVAACFAAYRPQARQTFRFPGWTPGEKFNPDKFFVLKGGVARAAWHVLRFNAYGVLGLLAGEVLMGSYAMTVANVGRLQDPRLQNVNETLKKMTEDRMKEKGLPIEDRTEGRRGQESFEMARQRTRAQGSGSRTAPNAGDDMSPTGGSFREDVEGSGGDMGMLSDSQIQQLQQKEQRSEEAAYQAASSPQASQQSAPRTSSSPTASPQSSSSNTGSAWERLRQQAGQQQSPQSQTSQQSRGSQRPVNDDDDDAFGLGGGSSSSGSMDQQDRSRMRSVAQNAPSSSRSNAQREFDAQLDRERQGESFNEKGGNSRW